MRIGTIKSLLQLITIWTILLCTLLFLLDFTQSFKMGKSSSEAPVTTGITPLQRDLLFDYPENLSALDDMAKKYDIRSMEDLKKAPKEIQKRFYKMSATPVWPGIVNQALFHLPSAPLFEKIREGQVWRLFTPALLHRDMLHILFNMSWLWLLGIQIEERLKKGKMLFLILLLGIFSNVAQYLTGGPYFMGFSGVITGLAGFIWSRQRVAPEEGYPLAKATLQLIFYFVIAMVLLGWVFLTLQALSITRFSFPIANTAHVVGGIVGVILGRVNFFKVRAIA